MKLINLLFITLFNLILIISSSSLTSTSSFSLNSLNLKSNSYLLEVNSKLLWNPLSSIIFNKNTILYISSSINSL